MTRLRLVSLSMSVIVALGWSFACGGPSSPSPNPDDRLSVTSVIPDAGLAAVSTPIRINGTGFRQGAQVSIGGTEVFSQVLNSTTITAGAPAHAAGPADVVVSQSFGGIATLPGGFTYLPAVDRIAISGNLVLANIGDTSQLTATATFADGSTRNVTNATAWSVAQTSVASISPTGVLTAVGQGGTSVFASYPPGFSNQSRFAFAAVAITPPGTFTVSGRTREPGAGDIGGVRVFNSASGRSVTSANGFYTMGGLTDDRLALSRDGYEPVEITATRNGSDDVPMQRILRLTAGGPDLASRIAPNDTAYDVGGGTQCQPCRLIRISGGSGTVTVRLTWTSPSRRLSIWSNGVRITANTGAQELQTTIAAGGEVIIYVGSTDVLGQNEHIPFSLSAG